MSPVNPFLEDSDDEYSFGNQNQAKAESKRSNLLNEAKTISQRKLESTQRQLSRQGEQLRNIDSKLESMEENLKDSQKNIDGMGSFFRSLFSFKKSAPSVSPVRKESEKPLTQTGVTHSVVEETGDLDSNVGLISSGVSRLRGLALGLNEEIEQQNKQLDKINNRSAMVNHQLSTQETKIKKLMK
ncbi:synaptosomal-associated protein 25-A-like [Octopus sinensis]|uniref:Synaptosomal-associated protein 25-A-like n=1 Tax=Octopus sinensis TaxID=2607531 RepID=A0A6P7TQT7_9MOLL|nr:synaptosomal-associated protein 25-A-like [Octopus sinensis]